jgi:mannosyltransferase
VSPSAAAPAPALVVHPHFHGRRTGITRHVESVLPGIGRELEARALGRGLEPSVVRIGWQELWRRIRRQPVIWHAHRNNELALGLLLRWLGRRVRLVFTRHASGRPSWWTRRLLGWADRFVALTPAISEAVSLRSTVIGHGVNLAFFRPPADRDAAWKALGLGGRYGVGVLGRVRPEKGQADFVAAIAPLLQASPEWVAPVVGLVRPRHAQYARDLTGWGSDRVVLVDEQRDVVRWYQGLTIVVHPSRTEGFSLVALEAMACGACLVATSLPYARSVIEHGRTGFLYPPGDVAALRAMVEPLILEPSRARAVGEAAAEEARARFGVEGEVRELVDLYRSLLDER